MAMFARLLESQVFAYLFCFNPEPDSRMGDQPKSEISRWRRVQLAKFMLEEVGLDASAFEYDVSGRLAAIAAPPALVDQVVAEGYAFMTNGCTGSAGEPGCTRPMGSWRPSEAPRDYPWRPTGPDLDQIRAQLGLDELVRPGPGPTRRGSCARRRSPAARLTRASRISEPLPRARLLAAIGVIAGLASGLLGVGGGFLIVPLLAVWLKMNQRRTSGTSLAAILPIALVGACIYYFFRGAHQVDITVAAFLVLGSVIGAYVGARTIDLVPERLLKVFIAILLLAVGLDEILSGLVPGALLAGHHPATHDALAYSLVVLSGVLIGVLSGLTGVGGGIFIVPTLVLGFGLSQHLAQGTSLVAILPTATVGAAVHLRRGNVDLRAAAWIGAAGAPAAVAGAALALVLPQPVLAMLFGLFLLFAAYRLWPRRNTATPVESPVA